VFPMVTGRLSIPAVLRAQAEQHPNDVAWTFIDYEVDPAGYSQSVTWSQVHQRAQVVAAELALCGSPGDRAVICASQGIDYIVGLLGAIQAGFIAVPLPVPLSGAHDQRVCGTIRDCAPAAVLTTSAALNDVASYFQALSCRAPTVIEIDALDLYSPPGLDSAEPAPTETALLQYTSGSTRLPAGVVVTHTNIVVNLGQMMSDHYGGNGKRPPRDTTVVSWLPLYHDLGLQFGVFFPLLAGLRTVMISPMAFLQRPARWMQLLATNARAFSGGPNFAFELVARRTSDDDMAGLDLGNVLSIASGAERVNAATIRRFTERFCRFNLPDTALRPGYGMAEATVYVSSSDTAHPPAVVRFDHEALSAGHATRCDGESGTELVSNGIPRACTVRIVDPDTRIENPAGKVGEVWVHGDNVAGGYWRNPQLSTETFGARLVHPSSGTPPGPWLRTGDLGFLSDGELFIVGRIKDILIIDGRNHYPDDIEATIQDITGGRVAAVAVRDDRSEQLVAILELKQRGGSAEEVRERFHTVKREVVSTVAKVHGLRPTDLVLVPSGSIPITTSGKVRRSACAQRYALDQFNRLDK